MGLGTGYITIGSRHAGTATVDPTDVRGDGGPARPQLVIQAKLELENRPADSQLAIVRLKASLHADQDASTHRMLCSPVEKSLTDNMQYHSFPEGRDHSNIAEVRFLLSQSELLELENLQHRPQSTGGLNLTLRLEPMINGIHTLGKFNQPRDASPWGSDNGMHSQMFVFWSVSVGVIQVQVSRETWIEKVLPGVGFDRLRLVEVLLPPPLPDHVSAASEFDAARRALDELRYEDCIGHCRGLIAIWERVLGSSVGNRVASVVAKRLRWDSNDPRRQFLDDLWKSATDLANVPHHPEGQDSRRIVEARDARLFFNLVTGLSEYLGSVPSASTEGPQ